MKKTVFGKKTALILNYSYYGSQGSGKVFEDRPVKEIVFRFTTTIRICTIKPLKQF